MAEAPIEISTPTFPPLAGSPYGVRGTERSQRWWFADGIWLSQGNVGASVGFGWTHWLADRGVEARGARLSDEYAHQLYRETRRAAGEDEDVDGGAQIDVAGRVLIDRGLVEECYTFGDLQAVLDALLERGPIVAGIGWHDSFTRVEDIEGWAVCRLLPRSTLQGGHCVLLNGIAPQLTIAGVTGFVRLKNSWGTEWGDRGHALISIDDLRETLELEASLLPIPAASALRSGLRQDVASDTAPYAPTGTVPYEPTEERHEQTEERYEQTAIGSDLWTRSDTVGAGAYADAIARGIQHVETRPPLTIGIKGAWGVGKTSLMRMIRDRLEWPSGDGNADELRPIHLTRQTARRVAVSRKAGALRGSQELSEVTHRTVLRKLRRRAAAEPDTPARGESGSSEPSLALQAALGAAGAAAPAADEGRWRPTVWFNPWMYQTGEQMWAGLANEIIRQVTERMSRAEQEHFWLHLNLRRIDEQAVRRRIYGLVLGRLIPYALLGVLLLLLGGIVLAFGGGRPLAGPLAASGPAVLLLGALASSWRVLGSNVAGGMSELVSPATRAAQSLGAQLSGAYEQLVEKPDYRQQSGIFYLIHTDIQRVLDLVATPERPLVIFIDDLDRCSPGTVVQAIEAINVFVAGDFRNSIFVIAMEPEMVAAHIEAVYGDCVKQLQQSGDAGGQAADLGWRFLEKIVQLPLALPAMEPDRTAAFFDSLFPGELAPVTPDAAPTGHEDPDLARALGGASLSEAASVAGDVPPDAASKEAVRRVVERRLTGSDPEVQEVMRYAGRFLERNPREIKRFANLFRFLAMIHVERRLARLPTPRSLREVAKLAVLGTRWPGLLSALGRTTGNDGQTVFELLEAPPQRAGAVETPERAVRLELAAAGLGEETVRRLSAPELTRLLTSEPTIGPGARGYL